MPDNCTANSQTFGEPADGPLSILCREIGLAAVAIEFNLELDALEPDVAEAIERGAVALFDAGYGSSLIGRRRRVWARQKSSRQKARRRASKARQSHPFPTQKGEIELRHETDGIGTERVGSLLNL
jgi:hypothetical protein